VLTTPRRKSGFSNASARRAAAFCNEGASGSGVVVHLSANTSVSAPIRGVAAITTRGKATA